MAKKEAVNITEDEVVMSIDLSGRSFNEDLTAQLAFSSDPGGLNNALVGHASRFAHWAAMECVARENLEEAKSAMALLESDLFRRIEQTLLKVEEKKPTLDRIRSEMMQRDDHQEAKETVGLAQVMLDRIIVGRQAMMHRKDCLIEVSRNMRAEMDAGLTAVEVKQEKGVDEAKAREEKSRRNRKNR